MLLSGGEGEGVNRIGLSLYVSYQAVVQERIQGGGGGGRGCK